MSILFVGIVLCLMIIVIVSGETMKMVAKDNIKMMRELEMTAKANTERLEQENQHIRECIERIRASINT